MKSYFFIPIALVPAYPVLASDYVLMIPMMMLYMLGMGPAAMIMKDPPLCSECGALIPARGPNAEATSH
jgi:Sec-independent protein secretion pathway component TatC